MINKTERITFSFTVLLVVVIIASCLIIFLLTPSPVSPTKRYFGYITNIYTQGNTIYLAFDRAQWLQDSDTEFPASTACALDKVCTKCSLPVSKSCLPDGYYIKNPDSDITTYPVAPFAKIGTLIINPDWDKSDPQSPPYKTLTLPQFENIYIHPSPEEGWIINAPFDITTIAGRAIIINQHFLPQN